MQWNIQRAHFLQGTAAFTDENPQYQCWAVPGDESIDVPCFGPTTTCTVHPYPRLAVADFGEIPHMDSEAIQREIAARGPVACAMEALPILQYDGSSVIEDPPELSEARAQHYSLNAKNKTDHIVEVVGWGIEDGTGTPYWELRNRSVFFIHQHHKQDVNPKIVVGVHCPVGESTGATVGSHASDVGETTFCSNPTACG
jgi:hypothetical protein